MVDLKLCYGANRTPRIYYGWATTTEPKRSFSVLNQKAAGEKKTGAFKREQNKT